MDAAVTRHRAGDLQQAEAMYRDVARRAPGHPDVHHLLGLVLHQQGRRGEARAELRSAIREFEAAPHYHNSLGEVLLAESAVEEALACFRRALELDPQGLPALNNLGLALHANQEFAAAAEAFEAFARRQPELSHAHNNLGIARQSLGDLEAAAASFRRACELAPEQAEAWNNLGAVLQDAGDMEGAQEALERAVALQPELARGHFNLSRLHVTLDRPYAAEQAIRRALELEPGEIEYFIQLGLVLRVGGSLEASMEVLRAALERSPGHAVANNDLGVSLLMRGDFAQAEKHLIAAIEAVPGLAIAYENLARTRRFGPGDAPLMKRMEELRDDPTTSAAGRIHLDFALGKMWDDREEPERAFRHLALANAGKHAQLPHDAGARSAAVDACIETFDADWFARRSGPESGHPSAAPVIVVGMLRSGTTLLEQILASHPQVLACGETDFFANLAAVMPERLGVADPYPTCARALSDDDLRAIASRYLSELFDEPGSHLRFTDKNPLNFDYLGLIAVMFPNARLVHVTRDPMATCFSVYMTNFARDNAFAYDLADIAAFYRDYQRLMTHWRAHLGDRIHEVAYEALVGDLEATARALVDHCGLEWDPACLDFHRTERMVGTASHWQVRQPLYSGALARWERYAAHLDTLRQGLQG